MKKTKFTIIFVLICIFHIINGELFQRYMKCLPATSLSFSFTDFPIKENSMIIRDFDTYSKKNHVDVYMEMPNSKNLTSYVIKLYCTSPEATKTYFREHYGIRKSSYSSLGSGTTEFAYYSIDEIPNLLYSPCFYVIGSSERINNFWFDLSKEYPITALKEGLEIPQTHKTASVVLFILGFTLILLTLYEISMNQKKTVLSLSLGESANVIIIKNIFADTISLLVVFWGTMFLLSFVTYPFFNNQKYVRIFLTFVFLMHCSISRLDFRFQKSICKKHI